MQGKKSKLETQLSALGLPIGTHFREQLERKNQLVLKHIRFALHRFRHLPNLAEVLEPVVTESGDWRMGRRRFQNQLTQLFAAFILNHDLGYSIEGLESKATSYVSPFARRDKSKPNPPSCDIVAKKNGDLCFAEVKDMSKQLETAYPAPDSWQAKSNPNFAAFRAKHPDDPGFYFFTPTTLDEVRVWIGNQVKDAVRKGAHFLMCNVPLWSNHANGRLDAEWVAEVFPGSHQIGPREFVSPRRSLPSDFFLGVHIIKHHQRLFVRYAQDQRSVVAA